MSSSHSPTSPFHFDAQEFRPGIHAVSQHDFGASSSSCPLSPEPLSIEEPGSWATVIEEERLRRVELIRNDFPMQALLKDVLHSNSLQITQPSFDEALNHIAMSAKTNSPFFGLNLSNKGLSKHQAKNLAEIMVLPENRMATLILSNNSIGDVGLHSIFQALKTNTSLTSLDLEKNDLTAKALRGCLEPLRQSNFTLSFLNLGVVKKKKSLSRKQFSKSDDPLAIMQALVAQNKTVFDCLYRDAKTVLLSDRKLSKVPDLLIPLGPNLTRLDLSQNLLTAVPDWFGDMSNLVSLNLAGNLLETLPDSLGLLEKLCTLVLTDNKLVKIPEAIVLLGHLENLFLENNQIHTLPTGVGSLGKLRILQLDGNPVVLAKRRSAAGDKSSALDILKERVWMGTETRDSFQMKLTILGRGNVGKTTLLRALKLLDVDKSLHNFRDVMRKSPNVATDGIEFDQWSVSRSNNRLVFTVLDCAGQSVYHLTHQFFLTGKSLFLVVFSLQDGNFANEIEYWLNAISGFCGNSLPVLVIGTHIDCEGVTKEYVKSLFQYLHRTVAHKFPMIRGYFGVSCTSGEGVSDLIDQMMNAVSSLPWLPVKIPVPFDVLREKLLGMEMIGRQILTRREFSKIAIVCGVPLNQVSAALEWFSDIGLLLQFEQVGGSLLSSTIVLSPQWLADLFKTIITLKANYVQGGFLLIKDLHHIWKPPSVPPQLHSRCVALLEHFEAVFRFSPDLLLVPALLPREPACISLQKHWPEVSEARFQDLLKTGDWEDCHHARLFTFKTFPPDFFSRLLVRIFRTRLWSPVVLWAHGAVLRAISEGQPPEDSPNPRIPWMPNTLFIEIDTSLNVISIRTRGSDSAANITRMSTAIESLVEDWLKIKYEILVPCLCSISKRLPEIASSITSMNQPMFSTLGSPSGCDHVQSTVPALSHNVASAYALCVEDVLQRDMEAHAPIVTDALSHLAVAAGEESSFRHFLAFFINAVHRYSSKSNRRHISFIASLPVNSSGQSMQNIVELLKSGQLPIVPAVDAAAEDEVEEIGISSLFRAVTDLPVINSNLPEDLRLLFSGMSLQTASGASLEIAVDNVIAIDQHLKALALAIRHTPLIESHITILKLTDCQIGSSRREGFTFLLDAILSTSTLTELDLSYNPLGEFGVLLLTNKLRAMFPNNLSLWTIGLDRVDCQFQPILELILTISAYSPIRNPLTYVSSLSLRQNSLGPEFFAQLVPVLNQHVSVWSLGLDCNPGCTDPMAHKASYLLRRNFQITTSMRYIYNKSLAMAQQFPSGEAVWSLGSVLSRAPPSLADLEQLTSATMLNHLIIVLRHNLACGDRYYKRRAYSNSFVARDAVSFLREYLKDLASRPCIVSILDRMLKKGWIVSLSRPTQADFMDSPHVCRFGPEELLPHIWKKFSQLIADMKRNIPRLTDSAGDESPCFLASSAVEYLSSNHDDISPAHAESLLEYLSEFSVIYNPAAPSQRFFNSDRDSFMFASQIPIGDTLQTLGDLHLFPLQQCTFAIKTQQLWFRCPRWHLPVRVDGLVPDISLDTLPFPRFTMDQVSDQVKISSPNLSSSGSVVTLGTHLGSRVVVKTMLEPDQRSLDNMEERNRSFDQFRREVWMMSSIKSKHIVRLLAFSITPPALMVEFMELGDLSHYVKQHPTPAWPERLRLITRVCKGLNFLHTCCPPIIHLDFKSPNVLLTYDSSRKRVITKISDFGLSRTLELTDSLTGNEDQDNCIWAAPEILSHKPATIKSDVYSLAIVMWEVFRWAQPFSEHRFMHTIYTAILRGDRPVLELTEAELADRQIKRFVELMQAAWAESPVSRPTVEEIVTRLKYLDRAMASDSSSDGATVSEDPVYCKPSRNRSITNFSFDGVVELPTISPSDLVDVKGLDLYSKIRIKRMSMQERSLSRSSSEGI